MGHTGGVSDSGAGVDSAAHGKRRRGIDDRDSDVHDRAWRHIPRRGWFHRAVYSCRAGELGIATALFGSILPALAGNVLGGTGIFAALTYAQVREEI